MAEHLLHTRVKTAKGRKKSSTAWLQRQLNDPYVVRAHTEGYRGRAAYKIIELNEQFHFFKKGARVVDLGAAPGGWSQVADFLYGNLRPTARSRTQINNACSFFEKVELFV